MLLTINGCVRCFKSSLAVNKGILGFARRNYVLKYVDPTKYNIDDIKVIQDDDPKSVKMLEKHGKAWHIMDEGRNASVAQTVSADFDMLNGLAREFAKHFKVNQQELKEKGYPLGSCVPVQNGRHYIYYLIIRENWWDRGAYRPMRESLSAMKTHAIENNVENIVMGRLGSQDDGLDFREILPDIKETFYATDLTLSFYTRRT